MLRPMMIVASNGNYYFYETATKKYWPMALQIKNYPNEYAAFGAAVKIMNSKN